MKKLFYSSIFIFVLLFVACNNSGKQGNTVQVIPPNNSINQKHQPIDTLALTLEALKNKRVPKNYQVIGELQTEILTYLGYDPFDEANQYIFQTANGNEIRFGGNDTRLELARNPSGVTHENKIVNTKYVDKSFRVVWRRIQLIGRPQSEHDYYYQAYDEIIYLKQISNFEASGMRTMKKTDDSKK